MLLSLRNVSLHLGRTALLDDASLSIDAGERLCLMGRNGAGKSTLLKVIAGELPVDAGEISRVQGLKVAQMPQDVPPQLAGSVYDVVAEGLGDVGRLIAEYHRLLDGGAEDLQALSRVQTALEAQDGWALESRVDATLSRLQLDGAVPFASLSGGVKRRALLGRALVADPDLLLLDEPTNHLDIESIRWLEDFLLGWQGTLLFITHDRAFVRRLATRIVELDRGALQSWSGAYDTYLQQKAAALHAEEKQNALFDKRLAAEEVWIRRGIEARRTRDQGRVQRLMAMRAQYGERRSLPGEARLVLQEADRSGKLVADLERASFARGPRPIVRNLSTTILRGDKVGIIGPNGAGKTTLLNLLLGRLAPDSGTVKLGTKQEIAYFDQLRAQLNDDQPVFEAIGNGREFVEIDGARKHVMTYLQEFLFTPDRARSPVRALSGGERSRLLLARLFSVPSNIVVLDEPTNDLDVETLDLLEELLIDYSGTVLLVSHDREFLDNVVTRCLVFEGHGHVGDYVGGYRDWLRQTGQGLAAQAQSAREAAARPSPGPGPAPAPAGAAGAGAAKAAKPARLAYKDQRELATLPQRIEELESEQARLTTQLSDPELYTRERDKARALQDRAVAVERELGEAYRRWEALESASREAPG
ncbi:MAG TPA: ATP-binding cassette domain-containing protein [Candidatus Binatia bacterium]|nr:ATP-binding cassette domain-containing protein [Candidatus Binatia bacterium]